MGVNCKCMKEIQGKSTLVRASAMLELEGVSCTAHASSQLSWVASAAAWIDDF